MSKVLISPVIHGFIDLFQLHQDKQAQLRGWIFREDTPIEKIDVTLQGKPWASAIPMQERPDVKTAFAGIIGSRSHIARSGFDVTASLSAGIKATSSITVPMTPDAPDGS